MDSADVDSYLGLSLYGLPDLSTIDEPRESTCLGFMIVVVVVVIVVVVVVVSTGANSPTFVLSLLLLVFVLLLLLLVLFSLAFKEPEINSNIKFFSKISDQIRSSN